MSKMVSVQGIRALLGPSDEDLVIKFLILAPGMTTFHKPFTILKALMLASSNC